MKKTKRNFSRWLSLLLSVIIVFSVFATLTITTNAATISLNRPLDKAYTITAREYYSGGDYHGAIDYGCPKGTPVYAAESGTVTVHDGGYGDGYKNCKDGGGWGNYIDISHSNGYSTRYAHMSAGRFAVKTGSSVIRGQLIGYSGNSGNSTGPHLHFGLYLNGTKVYPEPYIKTATGYGGTDTHKVDTSYGTNFTAYPKEKITSSNIFDVNHNQISSTAWIGTSDKCTIHEVYTDGCCKISYPLDSGGSQTAYSKVSLFNVTHTCNYNTYVYYEAVHPHRKCYKCSVCGKVSADKSSSTFVDSCLDCKMPGKPVLSNMKSTYTDSQSIKFEWKNTTNTTHYNIWIYVKNSQGKWVRYEHLTYVTSGVTKKLPIGEYRCNLQSYNSKLFWEDGSDWLYTEGDYCYFNVVDAEYTVNYNANGGTGAPASQTKIYGQTLTLSSVKPTRTGYTFLGWALNSTDTSVKYNSGASYTPNKAVTLYAVWKPNNLTVYYMANGGLVDSSTYGVGSDVIYTLNNGEKFTQIWTYNNKAKYGLGNAASFGLYKTGHTFKGWGTTSTGGKIFDENNVDLLPTEINSEIKTGNCSIALYAIWEPITYTVSYNANGGTGAPDSQIKVFGQTLTLSSVKPTRTGCTFLGWALNSTDTSVKYNLGDPYTTNSGVELFAVWEENHTCSFTGKEEIVNKVTCTENGSKKVYCYNADCEKYQLMTIVSKGHDYSEWVVTKEATLKEPGEKMRKCYVCRDAEIKVIAPLVPPIIIGDTNGDGRVNIKDATEIQKAVAGAITFGEVENLAADVDGNTRVNVKDATAIQKWIAGIETGFPIGDEKTF